MKPRTLVLHPSDEMYGADKVLLGVLTVLDTTSDVEVWLPQDVEYKIRKLSAVLDERGVKNKAVDLAVLRRAHLTRRGLAQLLRRAWRMRRALRLHRPDLIYVNTAALAVALLVAPSSTRRVVHLHEHLDGLEGRLLHFALRRADHVICVSESVRAQLRGRTRARSSTVHNGFSDPWLQNPPPFPTDERPVQVLLASRWNTWKGHREFLTAWGALERSDARLVVLGGPPPLGPATDVQAIVNALPNANTVSIQGEVDDVRPLLADCHLVVSPSVRPDPLPTIAIEALATGRAVAASDIGGLPEIVTDGATGFLLPPSSVDAWINMIESLNVADLEKRGRRGREDFLERFSQERFATEIGSIVRRVSQGA